MKNQICCRAKANNPNSESSFASFEIMTMREYVDHTTGGTYFDEVKTAAEFLDNKDAYGEIFYRVFGMYRNCSPRVAKQMGDFNDFHDAYNFVLELTGNFPTVFKY